MTRKIALSAGHHNTSGGNQVEIDLVGPVTDALADHCRVRGFDVRVIQPDNGPHDVGMFPGTLTQAAARVVTWAQQGWVADLFLEVHAESNGQGNAGRGAFAIYPDWGSDVDKVVRDTLGPQLVRAIRDEVGIPLRGTGVMSEKRTSVGAGGSRLGIFATTASIRLTTTRMILEIGSYSSSLDLSIMRVPGFPGRISAALATALGRFYALPVPVPPTPPVDAAVIGVQPSISITAFRAVLRDHGQPIPPDEADRVWTFCRWLEVDPAFLLALWLAEAGDPFGDSALQRQTRMPINKKTVKWEHRSSVTAQGAEWEAWQSWQLGLFASVLHLKETHGAKGRRTVRQIIPIHAPAKDGNDPIRIGDGILRDMGFMQRRPQ